MQADLGLGLEDAAVLEFERETRDGADERDGHAQRRDGALVGLGAFQVGDGQVGVVDGLVLR